MKMKYYLGLGAILIVAIGYYLLDEDTTSTSSRGITVNTIPALGDAVIEESQMTKTAAYQQAEEKERLEAEKLRQDTLKSVSSVANTMADMFDGNNKKALEEVKNKRASLVPVYDGKSYGPKAQEESFESRRTNPKVQEKAKHAYYAASLTQIKNEDTKPKLAPDSSSIDKKKKRRNRKTYDSEQISQETDLRSSNETKNSSEKFTITTNTQSVLLAQVFGDQTVKPGMPIKFRLVKEATVQGIKYPRNTIFNGFASFGQDRLYVKVNRLPDQTGSNFINVQYSLHDTDLQEGVYAPLDNTRDASIRQVTNASTQVLSMAMTKASVVANGTNQVVNSGTPSSAKVFIHDGDPVQFLEVKINKP
jgi:hypothetical protein